MHGETLKFVKTAVVNK